MGIASPGIGSASTTVWLPLHGKVQSTGDSHANRRTGAARGYDRQDASFLNRLAFIRDAQAAGFSRRDIRQILVIRDGGHPPCEHVGQLIDQRVDEVERCIVEPEQTRDSLRHLARRTAELDPADCGGYCSIIEATPAVSR